MTKPPFQLDHALLAKLTAEFQKADRAPWNIGSANSYSTER